MRSKTSFGNQAQVTAILGMRGSGKTTLLNRTLTSRHRLFLISPSKDPAFRGYTEIGNCRDAVLRSAGSRWRIYFVMDPADKLGFEAMARLAYLRGDCVFAVDELHEYVPNVFGAIPKYFKKLCLHGRHRNVEVFGVSQRPANVHKDFLSQAHRLHVFRLTYPGDLDALKRIIPNVERVRDYRVGECISYP